MGPLTVIYVFEPVNNFDFDSIVDPHDFYDEVFREEDAEAENQYTEPSLEA